MIGRMGCQAGHRYGNASYLASDFVLVSVTVGQTAIPEPLRPTPKAANSFMLISNLHKLAGYLRRIWALFLMLKAP